MDETFDEDEDFNAREYQVQLLDKAAKQNTILFLPTGSGKTFVAIMLIKKLSTDLEKSYQEGGKRTFFMVNTVALVSQQAASIRRHTPCTVGEYSGDMNVDYWLSERWQTELQDHQILVMTSQIFLDMLLHTYISLKNTNLLIFDECHHGVNDHPMRQIMQRFENCPKTDQPRVLGLSATLILGSCKVNQVRSEVKNLENTFHSKVATVDSMRTVAIFSTNPQETIVPFKNPDKCLVSEKAKSLIDNYKAFITAVKWPEAECFGAIKGARLLYPKTKTDKTLRNLLEDLKIHIDMLGLYGGSRACLAHLIQLERRRCRCEDDKMLKLHTTLITGVTLVYKLLTDAMKNVPEKLRITHFSSHKVNVLFAMLIKYHKTPPDLKTMSNSKTPMDDADPFCCVVFVQRRFTAKILYHILRSLQTEDPVNFGFIQPDYVVGFNNNPNNDTREGKLDSKRNSEVIFKFNKGFTNLMVSSDVLEEGVDVPRLSLVIKFDTPSNHSSYIQSKGRARHSSSNYVMMVAESDCSKFYTKYNTYQMIERELQTHLVGQTDVRKAPTQKDINEELYNHMEDPYYAEGQVGEGLSCITLTSAIQLLNRYCSLLPHDKFTTLAPIWYIKSNDVAGCVVSVQLPMSSPLKELITGKLMPTKKVAKRSAALGACKRLHEIGELDEQLLPRGHCTLLLDDSHLFPLWDRDDTEKEGCPKPGTKKRVRTYEKTFPSALSQCSPIPGSVTYMHTIKLEPKYPKPTKNRRIVFFDLLEMNRGYAILSSKRLPEICEFSIYLNVGEVKVTIGCNALQLNLTSSEIKELKHFNALIFNEVLSLEKMFLIADVANEENSFVVVPTNELGIDWDAVRTHTSIPKIMQPSIDARREIKIGDDYLLNVIAPWYRGSLGDQNYVVTKVCHDMSPKTQFPTNDFISYDTYFATKYMTKIMDIDQPLVEVKAISSKLHCLKPRSTAETKIRSKRKRQEMNEDFEEHLVPELCTRFTFPAVLWLKATCLPTVIHRLINLLLAEELRATIAENLSIGAVTLPTGTKWLPLVADENCDNKKPETLLGIIKAGPNKPVKTERMWGEEREPVDIERMNLDQVRLVEIQYHESFVSKSLPPSPAKVSSRPSEVPAWKIAMFANTTEGIGPQQYEILQALTATTANDIINLERCETLGDSFLKLAVSQFLFQAHGSVDEGKLTGIKGKLLGNRNLFYCGKNNGLGASMKVYDFSPKSDFVPPSMCVPRFITQVMRTAALSPNVLFQLSIPSAERVSGKISAATVAEIEEQLITSYEDSSSSSTMETFLGIQTVKDKTIADSVEALIGTYLKSCGVRGALLLLGWLKILPADRATPKFMFDSPPPSALLVPNGDVSHHLRACSTLEERLGYKFRDRSFLLQALTHPSYEANRITENYQRLEFLGDALLDFLITCHIYERCGKLTPGELTDLRSSLVNNICFASLVVRLGIHQFMLASSPKLLDLVDRFVRTQEERNHTICEQVLFLVEEKETKIAEGIDVPKVLGDLFESLAGAVYLDSNMSLETVWDVFYKLMHKEIEEFSKKVPKQPVRLLYEHLGQNRPIFQKTHPVPDSNLVMVTLEIIDKGKKCFFHGFGDNKTLAKTAAAKIAMKGLAIAVVAVVKTTDK